MTSNQTTNQTFSPVRAWTVVIAALLINLIIGVLYAWGVMAKALVGQWHWTKTEAALPFTVATAAFAITMIFAGRIQDKAGPRLVLSLGSFILGGGLILSSFVSTPLAMVATFGVVGGLGIGLCYSATTPPSIKWFPASRKGFITGIVVSGVGLAAVYISPLTQYLLKETSIPRTFLVLGVGAIVLIMIFTQFVNNPPAGYTPGPVANAGGSQASAARLPQAKRDMDWNEMLRTPQFYQLWAMFVLAASAGLMIIAHVAIIAKEQAKWEWGFVPIVTLAIFNTAGRVISGTLSDRIGRTRTMVLAFSLQAVNMFLFPLYTTPGLLVFGSAFTGLCYGTIFTLMPAATADFYGLRNLGVNYGILFTGFGVAGVVGPILGGRIRDHFGSYNYSFTTSAVLLLIGAAMAFAMKMPKPEVAAATTSPSPASAATMANKEP